MKEKTKFAFHISTHPFDGYYDMKFEHRGNLRFSLLLFFLTVVAKVLSDQMTAFLFNPEKYAPYDLVFEVLKMVLMFLIFCVANWSVTTLMRGEGTFRDIVMVTGYACLPLLLILLPVAIISNVSTYTEAIYLQAANYFAYAWFAFLLFTGIMTVHQYSLSRMLVTTILTAVAILVIIFLILLFYNLFSQIVAFFYSIYKEFSLRL